MGAVMAPRQLPVTPPLPTQKPAPTPRVLSTDPNAGEKILSTDPNAGERLDIALALNALSPQMESGTAKAVVDTVIPAAASMAGATFGASRGGLRGGYAGAGVGGAVGEGLAMASYPMLGLPLPPPAEAAKRMAISGATGTAGEFGAQKLFKLGGKVLSGASRRITPVARAVAEGFQTPIEYSPVTEGLRTAMRAVPGPTRWAADTFLPPTAPMVTPGQIPGTSFTRVAENIMEGSFLGSGAPRRIKDTQEQQLLGRARRLQGPDQADDALGYMLQQNVRQGLAGLSDDAQAPLPVDPATVGKAVQQGLSMNKDAWFKYAGQQFDKARKLGLPDVPLDDIKAFAQEQLKSQFAPEAMGKLLPTLKRIAAAGEEADPNMAAILQRFPNDPAMQQMLAKQLGIDATPLAATLDPQSAEDLASHLKSIIREDPRNEKMRGAAEQLLARLEASMEKLGEEAAPEARHFLKLGRDLWGGGHEQFRTNFLESVAEQYPSVLGKNLLRQPPEVLNEVMRAIPKGERATIEQAALSEILGRNPSAKDIDAIVKEFGEQRLNTLLGFDARRKIKEYQAHLVTEEADRLVGMLGQDPSEFAQGIRNRSVEDLRRMQQYLSNPSREALQQSTLQHVLEAGPESMASVKQIEDRLATLTPQRLTALVGPEGQKSLKELLTVMRTLNPEKDSRGRMFIQLTQAGGAIRLAQATALGAIGMNSGVSGESAITAGAVILGPAALSRIIMSPAGRNWLIQGVKAPPGSRMATRAAMELAAFMAREGLMPREDTSGGLNVDMKAPGGMLPTPPTGVRR